MEIVKDGDYFNVKNGTEFLAGKFETEEDAQYAIYNLRVEDFDCVWLFVLSDDRDRVTKEDIEKFRVKSELEEIFDENA